jgi:hypothetical protein
LKQAWNYASWNNGPGLLGCYVWEKFGKKIAIWKMVLQNSSILHRTELHPDGVIVGDATYDDSREIHLLQFRTRLVLHYDLMLLRICSKCGMRGDHLTADCQNDSRVCPKCNMVGHSEDQCTKDRIEWAVQDAIWSP